MSLRRPTRLPIPTLVALCFVFVATLAGPVQAHEGRSDAAVTALARVDGQMQGIALASAADAVALHAPGDRELRIVDLGSTDRAATAIDFEVASPQALRLDVLDLEGQVVRTLAEGVWGRGSHRLAWHHDSAAGESLQGGLYVVRLVRGAPQDALVTAR